METPVFVKRERELQRLDRFLAAALAGQGQVCFVAGEAGSGKTALVTEFARGAEAQHAAGAVERRAFVDSLLDNEPNVLDERFRSALLERTDGQALFTVELLRAMQERGDLVLDATGRWAPVPSLDWDALPARVEGVIGERIERLAREMAVLPVQLDALAGLARVPDCASVPDYAGPVEQSLEILGLIANHPALAGETRPVIEQALAVLRTRCSEEQIEAGLAPGKDLQLEEVVGGILGQGSG